jgi:hypothetical protein
MDAAALPEAMIILTLALAIGLALVHVGLGYRGPATATGLSFAGGISVAFVFAEIFPALGRAQETMSRMPAYSSAFIGRRVYLLALLGLILFYALRKGRLLGARATGGPGPSALNFWLHIAGFAALNLLVGYLLLHRHRPGALAAFIFFISMAAHFLRYDYGLRRDFGQPFERRGRWMLAAAVLAGWGLGLATEVNPAVLAAFFAVLAGAIILTALREEVPEERESSPWAFALGAASLILLQAAG